MHLSCHAQLSNELHGNKYVKPLSININKVLGRIKSLKNAEIKHAIVSSSAIYIIEQCLNPSIICLKIFYITVNPVLSGHCQRTKIVFNTNYGLIKVTSIAECSKWSILQNAPRGSILQYFRPSLSYHLSLRYLFCLFLSGCLRQVLMDNVI